MLKKITAYSLATVVMGAGQAAMAHTGVKDAVTEGKSLYTAFTITHGCSSDTNPVSLPVKAQSAIFPNAADAVAHKLNADGTDGNVIDLSTVIEGVVGGGVTTLSPKAVMDKGLFSDIKSVIDAGGVIRGIQYKGGVLPTDMVGLPQFRVSSPKFLATSCAKSLKVRIAVANFCTTSASTDADRRADIWIGHMTPKFNDPGVMPHGGGVYWPTLTVNRDLAANPMKPACAGKEFDVAVEPSDADIDANLPIQGYWPAN